VIQYLCGKFFGNYQLTSITTKTLEGYLGGSIITPFLFYSFPTYCMKLNLIGMLGGLISSSIKRKIGIKHWSNLLGPHGGINDRLDSIILPILIWFIFF
jgi:phosphatidate cytidylyltransferase